MVSFGVLGLGLFGGLGFGEFWSFAVEGCLPVLRVGEFGGLGFRVLYGLGFKAWGVFEIVGI